MAATWENIARTLKPTSPIRSTLLHYILPASFSSRCSKSHNSEGRNQESSKTYVRYAVRQKRADAKSALKNLLFDGKPVHCVQDQTQRQRKLKTRHLNSIKEKRELSLSLSLSLSNYTAHHYYDMDLEESKSELQLPDKPVRLGLPMCLCCQTCKDMPTETRLLPIMEPLIRAVVWSLSIVQYLPKKHAQDTFAKMTGMKKRGRVDDGDEGNFTWTWAGETFTFPNSGPSGFEWRDNSNWHQNKKFYNESDVEDECQERSNVADLMIHRATLGLPHTGPLILDHIKSAFRSAALKWHPDKHEGPSKAIAEEKFKLCVEAYKALSLSLTQQG